MVGFIGVGNMGGTLAAAVAKAIGAEHLLVSSRTMEKAAAFAAKLGCSAAANAEVAAKAQFVFLGVKPQKMAEVLAEIVPVLAARTDRFILVTMAAGLTTTQIETMAGRSCPVIRIMPNTPAAIGCGVIPYCSNAQVAEAETQAFCRLLQYAGHLDPLPEALMDAASALSGCGPAFVYIFIEALADAAVACGLPRSTALAYAAQTVRGAAQMVLESGAHPAALKDAVCSPAGSTIAGVHALEANGFRAAAEQAVLEAYRRAQALGKIESPEMR